MSPEYLHKLADWASVFTFVLTLTASIIGLAEYVRYRCRTHKKSKQLEQYLRNEKANQKDRGQRSVLQIVRDVGLTEDEIIQVSFRNPRVGRRVKLAEDGLAGQLLFEYQDKTS